MIAPNPMRWRLLLLTALLVLLAIPKLSHSVGAGPYGLDASYYFQIARNVAEGKGLVTNVSLYHSGPAELPERTNFYPLWPLLLGLVGRLVGMVNAVDLLPRLLYLVDLVLLYVLANRISLRCWGRSALLEHNWSPDLGHLFVLLLGTNSIFFASTTHPYTEGLAFALVFMTLLLLDKASETRPLLWASIAGVAAGLAFLTRTQMIVLVPAGVAALSLLALRDWRRFAPAAVSFGVVGGGIYLWWRQVFLFGTRRYSDPEIRTFQSWVGTDSWLAFVNERVEALKVGFDVSSPHSYVALFGPAALLVPIAVATLLWRRRRSTFDRATILLGNGWLVFNATVLAGLLSFAALTLYHGAFFRPWLFGWRHGLPYILLLVPAVAYLLFAGSRMIRLGTIAVVLLSIVLGLPGLFRFVTESPPSGPTVAEQEMIEWLEGRQQAFPTLLTTHAQTLSVHTDAYIHWTHCSEPPEKTRLMLERLPIDYVVVYRGDRQCPFIDHTALQDVLTVTGRFGRAPDDILVLERRGD